MPLNKYPFVLLLIFSPFLSLGWGFYAHKKINEQAVYSLPPELFGFYKNHLNYLTERATDPDKRRYAVENEGPKHFLDADYYEKQLPLDTLPKNWFKAVEKYSLDTLQKHGIGPWNLQLMQKQLVKAFEEKNIFRIIKLSTDMGHYVADMHVPLHTTSNYNGQKTGQHGIHGLWESRLPELFASNYNFVVGRAVYIDSVEYSIWDAFEKSHSLVDSVLNTERRVSNLFSEDKKYVIEQRGASTVKTYSREFSSKYHQELGTMVEDRMKDAMYLLSCLWYTAWVEAGMPNLELNQGFGIPEYDSDELKEIETNYQKGSIKGREEPNE
jgi:hypothetical protein